MPFRFHFQTTYHIHNIHRRMRNKRQTVSICQLQNVNYRNDNLTSLLTRPTFQRPQASRTPYHPTTSRRGPLARARRASSWGAAVMGRRGCVSGVRAKGRVPHRNNKTQLRHRRKHQRRNNFPNSATKDIFNVVHKV